MKASLTVTELSRALQTARKAVRSNPSLLAYSGVLFEVAGSHLTITGADGELSISATASLEAASDGTVLLSPKPLGDVLARLPDNAVVQLELQGAELVLKGTSLPTYRFRVVDATFAKLPAPKAVPTAGLELLPNAVSAITTALSGASQPLVQLVASASGLILYATDGFRLARVSLPGQGFEVFQGVLPLQALDTVASLRPTAVAMDAKGRTVRFDAPGVSCILRLSAAPFPNAATLLENLPPNVVALPRADVHTALLRLSAVADSSPLRCEVGNDTLVLSVQNPDRGEGREEVAVPASKLAGLSFGANPQFLVAALASLGSDICRFAATSGIEPLFFSTTTPLDVVVVVMPVKLDN